MTAKERILLIRLMEKLERQPGSVKAPGLEAAGAQGKQKENQQGLTDG